MQSVQHLISQLTSAQLCQCAEICCSCCSAGFTPCTVAMLPSLCRLSRVATSLPGFSLPTRHTDMNAQRCSGTRQQVCVHAGCYVEGCVSSPTAFKELMCCLPDPYLLPQLCIILTASAMTARLSDGVVGVITAHAHASRETNMYCGNMCA